MTHCVLTSLPGTAVPYVVHEGDGLANLVAGQVIRTLAGVEETSGGFGAVVCEAPLDPMPIPMHWHEREHDTWFCTRGKLQVWSGDESRVLAPGDFAYVKPGGLHSYQSVAPRTSFFGVVAPGGWEGFFADAGEPWSATALPPPGRPFDFSRMGPAMGKYRIMRVEGATFAPATPMGSSDQQPPTGHDSFFLEAGYGPRHVLLGHLATGVLSMAQSDGKADMLVIEGGRGAALPALRHNNSTLFLYVLQGELHLTLDGTEHRLAQGDGANIPPGTTYATRIISGSARWIATSAGGNAGAMWARAGTGIPHFSFLPDPQDDEGLARLRGLADVDVAIV